MLSSGLCNQRFKINEAFEVLDFSFFGRVFGLGGVKMVQQSSNG